MAHQAHALPWSCFANYEYTIRPHISSLPQLYMIESPNRLKELQHFANVFARRIREFGVSERAKYASSESFQQRAETWKKSDMDPKIEVPGVTLEKGEALESGEKWRSGKKSRGPHVERKKVYSDAFKAKYKTVYEDWEPYKIESKQDIASWISLSDSYDENSCIDTLKILLMEAAAATHPVSERVEAGAAQKHAMESLLLLANKKETSASIRNWKHRGMYSEHYGIETVAEKALDAYLMFNLFFAMRENGSGICELDVGQDWLKESSGWYRSFMVPKEVETLRPKYMNTRLWADVVGSLASSNYYNSEHLMHRTFLFPQWRVVYEKQETVRDVLIEGDELREYLKGAWRILVIYEVFWKEMGIDIEWEELLADTCWLKFKAQMVFNKDKGRMWFY